MKHDTNGSGHSIYFVLVYWLRICTRAWRYSRTTCSRFIHFIRCVVAACSISNIRTFAWPRRWYFHHRCCFVDLLGRARPLCPTLLDVIDGRDASNHRLYSPADRISGACFTSGISDEHRSLELSDVASARGRNLLASKAVENGRCRSLLEALLTPLGQSYAPHWSKLLIDQLGTLYEVLRADSRSIYRIVEDDRVAPFLTAVLHTHIHTLRTQLDHAPILSTSEALIDYLMVSMAHEARECVRVLFLNGRNMLLGDEIASSGSINRAALYPRDILGRALELGATALILVHNHPSGDPRPSRQDIDATRVLAAAAKPLDIVLHDHLIIASTGWSSLIALYGSFDS
jgi:DNA repair protein RadC